MKALYWSEEDRGMTFNYEDIPADLQDQANEYHEKMVEAAAESSEELMDKYLEGTELTIDEIQARFT